MRVRTRVARIAITEQRIAAAMWGRAAEYVHGRSVHGAVALNEIDKADPTTTARIALAEIVHFAERFGGGDRSADRINYANPNPQLRTGHGLSLISAATVSLVHVDQAVRDHPGTDAKALLASRITDNAARIIEQGTYTPALSDGESIPYRLGDAAADLLAQLVRLAIEDIGPRRAARVEAHDLLHQQFQRLEHDTPTPAWLPI